MRFFCDYKINEGVIMSAKELGQVADIIAAFIDTPTNLIRKIDDEYRFEYKASKYGVVLKGGRICCLTKDDKKDTIKLDGRLDSIDYVIKALGAKDKLKAKIKELERLENMWKK